MAPLIAIHWRTYMPEWLSINCTRTRMQGIFGEWERANVAEEFSTSFDHTPDAETGESSGEPDFQLYLQKPTVRISVLTSVGCFESQALSLTHEPNT